MNLHPGGATRAFRWTRSLAPRTPPGSNAAPDCERAAEPRTLRPARGAPCGGASKESAWPESEVEVGAEGPAHTERPNFESPARAAARFKRCPSGPFQASRCIVSTAIRRRPKTGDRSGRARSLGAPPVLPGSLRSASDPFAPAQGTPVHRSSGACQPSAPDRSPEPSSPLQGGREAKEWIPVGSTCSPSTTDAGTGS